MGSEKVSTIQVVSELINNTSTTSLPCRHLTTDYQLRNIYASQSAVNKELLGQALLLVTSFMELCIYKNANSWTALRPGRNDKKL